MKRTLASFLFLGALTTGACVDSTTGEVIQETASSGVTAAIVGNGFVGPAEVEVKANGHVAKVEADAVRFIMQDISIAPGGHTGWHSHGGMALVTVTGGALTLYSEEAPCTGITYATGSGFVDPGGGHVHIGVNEGSVPTVLKVQYILPDGAPVRIDAPAPGEC